MTILDEIAAERRRQVAKGYDAAHDDEHDRGGIAAAAAAYALIATKDSHLRRQAGAIYPWSDEFGPEDERASLIIAAALCIAEIERLDRASA